jgi:Skp family chaperone for outer membrane proteins
MIVVGVFAGGRLWSQDKPQPAAPRTRVALINATYVISNYSKYKEYKEEWSAAAKPYEDRIKDLTGTVESLKKEYDAAEPLSDKRDEIDKAMKKVQHSIEKASADAKRELGAKAQVQSVEIYKELQSACERYAKSHDLDLVLHYNEPVAPNDLYGPDNVERKLGANALIPLYWADGMDISKEILDSLNESK